MPLRSRLESTSHRARLWEDFLARIRNAIDSHNYAAWFRGLQLHELSGTRITVAVPNLFARDLIEKRFHAQLLDAARACLGDDAEVAIRFRPRTSQPARPSDVAAPKPPADDESDTDEIDVAPPPSPVSPLAAVPTSTAAKTAPASSKPAPTHDDEACRRFRLNEAYTFDDFVIGPNNELAHAACLQAVAQPARSYNPLFIYGPSGLGKSHLLHATVAATIERHPDLRVMLVSCEEFVNRFVAALESKRLTSFRETLRNVDCLVIDDVHFLAKKKRMQEEFFHTFNALYDRQKQIILSADSRPHDMAHFEERLLTRFQWGLLVSVEPPNRPTREAIVRHKARALGETLTDDVVETIAGAIDRNVRELEGAVIKLLATATLFGRTVDRGLAERVVAELGPCRPVPVTIPEIARVVATEYDVDVPGLRSPSRVRSLVVPRQLAMFLAKAMTNASLTEIGQWFGRRDHSTVVYAIGRAEARLADEDVAFRRAHDATRRAFGYRTAD